MAKFAVTKLHVTIKEHFRYRLVVSAILAITLATLTAVIVRSEVRAAGARRHAASSKSLFKLFRLQVCAQR